MGAMLNKGKYTVGGSNSKLAGEANHGIRTGRVSGKPGMAGSMSFDGHANKSRDLGMSVAMPSYGSSGRDGLGGAMKPFTKKMGGRNAAPMQTNNNPKKRVYG